MTSTPFLLFATLLAGLPGAAQALSVAVTSVDLNDALGPGGDYWELRFAVSQRSFAANEGFAISFDPSLFAALTAVPAQPSADWDVLILQPDPGLPADGLLDAVALVDAPSLAVSFVVRLVWLGGAGSQLQLALPFEVTRFAPDGSFLGAVESGTTVPEPPGVWLFVVGLALAARPALARCGHREVGR